MAMPEQPPRTGTTGINRLIASAFRVRLVSDVPERLARSPLPYRPDRVRRDRIVAIERRGVLFVHVPKNAGTTICQQLYGRQLKHHSVRYYASVAPQVLNLPSFAILREPVCRFRSAFAFARSGGSADRTISHPFNARYRAFESIDDAIDHLATARSPFDVDHIFRPQAWYLTDAQGRCRVDNLVPYEDIDYLGTIMGLDELDGLPRINGSTNSCSSAAPITLNPSQEAFIEDFYSTDLALWRDAVRFTSPTSRPCSARRATS